MKDTYENLSIDIGFIMTADAITTSSSDNEHDNGYIDWGELE